MSNLKNKSEINRVAAERLHKESLYPSVIHCAYYSCFQLLKHIWIDKMGKTELELSQEIRKSPENSHEYLINQIVKYINSKQKQFRIFNTSMQELKKLRVKADYKDEQIDREISEKSIQLCDNIQRDLKSNNIA